MKKSHRWYVDSLADHMRVINNRVWAVFSENFLGPRYSVSAGDGVIPDVLAIEIVPGDTGI